MTIIAMFPGQSSRYPEMLMKFGDHPVLAEAREILGCEIDTSFATNRDVQVGVFLANFLHLTKLAVPATWSLGLSLGEYNHLVHIGALGFEDALRLVDARGRLYDEAQGGLMVSVFPLEAWIVDAAIQRLGIEDRVAVGLYNSPRQQVISGERAAVEQVLAELDREEFFDATVIEPRIPMHAPCFGDTAKRFAEILDRTPFATPRSPYVPNVLAEVIERPRVEQIKACLVAHVHRPVLWRASVEALAARVEDPEFIEVGPRAVLHNMFGKDWMPGRRGKTDAR